MSSTVAHLRFIADQDDVALWASNEYERLAMSRIAKEIKPQMDHVSPDAIAELGPAADWLCADLGSALENVFLMYEDPDAPGVDEAYQNNLRTLAGMGFEV